MTGAIKSPDDLAEDDFRRSKQYVISINNLRLIFSPSPKADPRYQGEAFKLNMRLVEKIGQLAADKSKAIGEPVTPASFCLAWVLYQGEDFFVIPGTKSSNRFKENLSAGRVLEKFTKEDDEAVRKLVKEIDVVGERYAEAGMKGLGL